MLWNFQFRVSNLLHPFSECFCGRFPLVSTVPTLLISSLVGYLSTPLFWLSIYKKRYYLCKDFKLVLILPLKGKIHSRRKTTTQTFTDLGNFLVIKEIHCTISPAPL